MSRLQGNPLVMWAIGLTVGYWSFGFLVDKVLANGIMWSAFVSACLLVFGSVLLVTIIKDFFIIMREGIIDDGRVATIGLSLISMGFVWSGLFGLAWNFYSRPDDWIGIWSSFGRSMSALGVLLVFYAPEAARDRIRPPNWWLILITIIFMLMVGVLFGATLSKELSISNYDTSGIPRSLANILWRST